MPDRILCDVSAGVGDYTLACAPHFKCVIHCDRSVDALRYALASSRRMGLEKVFFLRVDYFALPFRGSIDRLLCLDTLIRGEDHERALLSQIQRAVSSEGRAIVDFHHWWHNPLRRLGLLRQNFGNNHSYTRARAESLIRECGIRNPRLVRFHQEFEPERAFSKGLSWLLPATRLLYEFGVFRRRILNQRRSRLCNDLPARSDRRRRRSGKNLGPLNAWQGLNVALGFRKRRRAESGPPGYGGQIASHGIQ